MFESGKPLGGMSCAHIFLMLICSFFCGISDVSGETCRSSWGQAEKAHSSLFREFEEMLRKQQYGSFVERVKSGEDVHAKDETGATLLHVAARHAKDAEIIRVLLVAGAEINAVDAVGCTPLHMAVGNGRDMNLPVIASLLGAGADPNIVDAAGATPLHMVMENDQSLVPALLAAGADVNAKDNTGTTPLHLVVEEGVMDMETIEALLGAGAEINAADGFDLTPLHVAMEHGDSLNAISVLLTAGANPRALSMEGLMPLHMMARNHHFGFIHQDRNQLAEWMSDMELDVMARNHQFISQNRNQLAEWLSDMELDVDVKDRAGSTPLHYAVQHYNLGMILELVKLGAGINEQDERGMIPLHWMAQYRTPYFARALRELASCRDIPKSGGLGGRYGRYGGYGLQAFPEHSGEAEREWRERDYRSRNDWMNEERALEKCDAADQVMDVLLDGGADVNAVSEDGSSPLYYAAKYSSLMFLRKLLEAGADPNLKRKDGSTPLRLAIQRDEPDYALALLEAGAKTEGLAPECAQEGADSWAECAMEWSRREREGQSVDGE